MTPHDDIEPEADRALDELLDAANEEAESDEVTRPPFAAVLGRARRLDPTLTPPTPARSRTARRPMDDATMAAALAPFVSAARAEAEHDVARQRSQGHPGLPRRGRVITARWIVIGGTLAAAAVVVLLLGLLDGRNALRADARQQGNAAADQVNANRPLLEAATGGDALPGLARRGRSASAPQPKSTPDHVLPDEPAPLEDIEPSEVIPEEPAPLEAPAPQIETSATDIPTPTARRAIRKKKVLRRLDELASTRLASGDAAGAEKAYRTLVRKGGRSGLAELAYGDLFTLAHARRDRTAQQRLWRDYLRRFPRGRFADDARAGLCRNLAGAGRTTCWERYLDDFPTGAYHRQAERALSRE